ncbi:hypothetical protein HIM_03583 [Hirsutella minnesotensis 3608]|uniref:Aquaporin-1 n=1 Tax=Hirsutella minnesotensis 3608 TaxID=1043627 RepID=A0A0F8A2T6_9HYPO|nr:hypothetical protein HIM_03583 [Hirsutella minnesotensis 3608]
MVAPRSQPSRSILESRATSKGTYYFVPSETRNNLIVIIGEFSGTFMFLLLSFIGAQAAIITNNPSNTKAPLAPASILFIAVAFGVSLTVNVWIFFRVSGGMFNPAVTLGLVLVGAVPPLRGLLIFPAQLAAGIAASAIVFVLLPGDLSVGSALGSDTNVAQGLFIEMFLTAQLVLTVYFLAVEKHRATYIAPIGIGASVVVAHLAGINFTGCSINPARTLGPAVFVGFPNYHWIYWIGPFLGALLAWIVYSLLKWLDYKTANPGQDADDIEAGFRDIVPPMMSGSRGLWTSDGLVKSSNEHFTMKDHNSRPSTRDRIRRTLGTPTSPYLNVRFSWNKE